MLPIEEAALHRVPVIGDSLARVMLVGLHQGIYFVLVGLVLYDLNLIMRRGQVGIGLRLLPRLLVSTDHHRLLVIERVLRLDDVRRCSLRRALLLGCLLLPAVVGVVDLTIAILLSIFVVRVIVLVLEVDLVGAHVCGDVMRLKVVFVLHDKHVLICYQMVRLIRHRVIQFVIKVVVAVVVLLC